MKWSFKVGAVSGIGIYVHVTFLILVGWFGLMAFGQGGVGAALGIMVFIVAVFGCVVLHELGHALTAKRFGIRTRDITLLPIGGVARLERIPENPKEELLIALAGPAVNVVIAIVLFALIIAQSGLSEIIHVNFFGGHFLVNLLRVNLMLVGFNLLPAFPMDGGRVLRAYLAQRMDYVRATQIAATVGQGMAILFGIAGLFGMPMLLFIALFVYMGAASELDAVQMRFGFSGIPVKQAMMTNFRAVSAFDPLSRVVEELLHGSQHDFPVMENGRVIGILTRSNLLNGLSQRGLNATVGEVMTNDCGMVDAREMLMDVFQRMQTSGCSSLPVVVGDTLVGVISLDNIGEFIMIQTALRSAPQK